MLGATAVLTSMAPIAKTAAERWLATPVDARAAADQPGRLVRPRRDPGGVAGRCGDWRGPRPRLCLGLEATRAAGRWALTMIMAGGAANASDRLPNGVVTDYLLVPHLQPARHPDHRRGSAAGDHYRAPTATSRSCDTRNRMLR